MNSGQKSFKEESTFKIANQYHPKGVLLAEKQKLIFYFLQHFLHQSVGETSLFLKTIIPPKGVDIIEIIFLCLLY